MGRGRDTWTRLDSPVRAALSGAWASGVPPEASAFHARWWQFETWLRSLAYVELRAAFGEDWQRQLPNKAVDYAKKEARLAYMPSPDAGLILSYLDVFDLFDLIDSHWDIFESSLIDKEIWLGRLKELRQIRHRNAHCRRPHADDLGRIEQTLRDLEPGAFRASSAFNDREYPARDLKDPLVDLWIRRTHETASRLIDHAASNYRVDFRLNFSRRPWASTYVDGDPVSGRRGYLWHACFIMHEDGIDIRSLWEDDYLNRSALKDKLVYLCASSPYFIEASFSALDGQDKVADAIGNLFDAILVCDRNSLNPIDFRDDDSEEIWTQRVANLDPRVQVMTPWAMVETQMQPLTIFYAKRT